MSERTLAPVGHPYEEPQPRAQSPMDFTEDQKQLIRDSFANGASDAEFAVLLEVARARRLNPLLRQIHFVQRWDSEKHRMVWASQVSIDGLRALAERTGLYQGQDEPEFVDNPDGTLKLCKVRVWRKDWPRPAVGIAYWNEYVQTTRDKQTGKTRPTAMWARMPHVMLSKCAEALALRKAFPEDMAGLYTTDEMAQSQPDAQSRNAQPARPDGAQASARVTPIDGGSRTELHIHASLPAVASKPREEQASHATVRAPTVVKTVEAERAPAPPAAPANDTAPRKPSDPWMDFYG
ncbi:MAG: phage recombination protein Bet [Polyangiales bacterium]